MTPSGSHLPEPQVPRGPALAITVPALSGEVAGIRRAIGALAARAGLCQNRRSDIALAVGEACANSVVHAYADREVGLLHVTADITPAGLEVVISDDGRGMVPRADSPGLGLGLPLMASLTTSLEFGSLPAGGTEIRMSFAAEHPGPGTGWAQTA